MTTETNIRSMLSAELQQVPCANKLVNEFWIPRTNERADLVEVGPGLRAFEIKSQHDSLRRLPRQIEAYGRLFDQCSLVVAERHAAKAESLVPGWWGFAVVLPGECLQIEHVRSADENENVDSETLVRLLWRGEVQAALARLGRESSSGRFAMWIQLLESVETTELKSIVRSALLNRIPPQLDGRKLRKQSIPQVAL